MTRMFSKPAISVNSRSTSAMGFGIEPAFNETRGSNLYAIFGICDRCRGNRPACRKGLQTIRVLESASKVAWSAGVSRCRAQYVGWACGMQIRLFREHKNDAALKCEIQDFPTKAFQLVIGGFLERAPLHRRVAVTARIFKASIAPF
jgi:hypothetical protein